MAARSPSRPRPRPRARPASSPLDRLLDPIDRLSETIFSVLILLTFTLAFRIFKLGDPPAPIPAGYVNELLVAAMGATLAWGLIDGVMYALMELLQRGERHRILAQLQAAATEQERAAVVADELDHILEPIADEAEREALYRSVAAHLRHGEPRPVGFKREDFVGALGCVLVSVVAVLPSLVPFLVLRHDPALAIRVSNVVSFGVLFWAGYSWGTYTGASPWRTGLLLVAFAALMVAVAIPLGG
jgi:VIT1/CCC1 family predicted Fe2+/Mn2+ transporter